MKKNIICTNIRYAFLHEVDSIDGSTINLLAGFDLKTLETEKAEIAESLQTSGAGDRVKQELNVTSGQESVVNTLLDTKLILELTLESGDVKIMGNELIPTQISKIQGSPPAYSIQFIRHAKDFEFL